MPDVNKKSSHIPEFAGDIESFTGSLIVDTGLREVQSIVPGLAQAQTAGASSATATLQTLVPGTTLKAKLEVWESDGTTASEEAASVSWMALGR